MASRAKIKKPSAPPPTLDLIRRMLDDLPARAWVKDADGKYLYVNQRMLEDFTSSEEDWIGTTDADHFSNLAESYRANDETVLSTRKPLRATELVERGNRQEFALSLKFPVTWGDELLIGGI